LARTGVLLINLGSPDAPDTASVRAYLREFLMDPRVLDMPAWARWTLVNGVILRTRPAKTAAKYREIWTSEGSPLLVHTDRLARRVATLLGRNHVVRFAMRYGAPSIHREVVALIDAGVSSLVFVPLYPQSSGATTGSALDEISRARPDVSSDRSPSLTVVPPFHEDSAFLDVSAALVREDGLADDEHLLFSFHGLPSYQVRKADASGVCLTSARCCDTWGPANAGCYRAQCVRTAHQIAARLGRARDTWTVAFQSRIGPGWIGPHTDRTAMELARRGVKKLVVACPAFVADCLETLEEIGLRLRDQFKDAGGKDLRLVPSLNSDDRWAAALTGLIRRHASGRDHERARAAV
jgi:protoporphyrin/coproporphyrin ferrochelatase